MENKNVQLFPSTQDAVFTSSFTSLYNHVKHAANEWQIQAQKCSLRRSQANGLRKGLATSTTVLAAMLGEAKFVEQECLTIKDGVGRET